MVRGLAMPLMKRPGKGGGKAVEIAGLLRESGGKPNPADVFAGTGELRPPEEYGPWRVVTITDVGRPIGRPFQLGQSAYVRRRPGISYEGLELPQALYHLYLPGPVGPVTMVGSAQRREISQTQLDNATKPAAAEVSERDQRRYSDGWAALVPKTAPLHKGTLVPTRWYGDDVALPQSNPDVSAQGWQGDSVRRTMAQPGYGYILDPSCVVHPPSPPSPEQLAFMIRDWLEHERLELIIKAALADRENPMLSEVDRARRMEEVEGIAHAYTVMLHDGYYGPDGERRYLEESDYATMTQLGFGALVKKWRGTDG